MRTPPVALLGLGVVLKPGDRGYNMTAHVPSVTSQIHPGANRAWTLLGLRLVMVVVLSLLMWMVLRATTGMTSFPPTMVWATLGLLPVNILCLVVLVKFYREQGLTLRQAIGVTPGRVGRDMLWGLLWLLVLNVPFTLAVSGTVFVMYGADAPEAFATIFVDPDALPPIEPTVLLMLALVSVVPFMVLNAPVEELVFRGYGLAGLRTVLGRTGAIIATSLLFGAQHIFFAATPAGMVVFFVAFTVWGLIAAVIVTRQGRLFPVVIAHWIINIMLSAPAIVMPILQLTDVIR